MTVQNQSDGTTQRHSFNGNIDTFFDEASHSWQRTNDALGRLTNVVEPDGASTVYVYDTLNNLSTVTQNGLSGETPRTTRRFVYDGLSRLTSATNGEAGTIGYGYDGNGNVTTKTDGRGATVNYVYDALNRMTSKSSAGANGVSGFNYVYGYDSVSPAVPNGIGRLLYTTTSPGIAAGVATQYFYDAMGRLTGQSTGLPSTPNAHVSTSATYDLAGNITSLTYPDGRTINQIWDAGGHLNQTTDGSGYVYLTSQSSYWPNGEPQAIWYGNGVANGTLLNNRLQIQERGSTRQGTAAPGNYKNNFTLAIREYCYGEPTPDLSSTVPGCQLLPGNPSGIPNNGNIWQIVDALNSNATENFNYDNLNRLTYFQQVGAVAGAGQPQQTYAYDSFGNLNQNGGSLQNNVSYDANNRINNNGFGYDLAGNVTTYSNGIVPAPLFAYDADNKLVTINGGGATYAYDAKGERVRKDVSPDWTEYVNFNGQVIAEKVSDGSWSDYIFANGQRIARVENNDIPVHMHGVTCSGSSCPANEYAAITSFSTASTYTVRPGDLLTWRQYEVGAYGGLLVGFTDSTGLNQVAQDTDGEFIDADQTMGSWHERVVDLSPYAGKTINGSIVPWKSPTSGPGTWDLYFGDINLVSTDGTVIPLYNRSLGTVNAVAASGITDFSGVTEKGPTPDPRPGHYHLLLTGSDRLSPQLDLRQRLAPRIQRLLSLRHRVIFLHRQQLQSLQVHRQRKRYRKRPR